MLRTTQQTRRGSALLTLIALTSIAVACSKPDSSAIGTTTTLLSSSPPPAAASRSTGSDPGPNPTASDPGPNPTTFDPGPNPTTFDPGPNETSGGPQTVRGILVLDSATTCIAIDSDAGRLDLRFAQGDYAFGNDGAPALVDGDGIAIAHSGDTVFVAGFNAGTPGDCGGRFDVGSLVSVLPAG